MSVLEDHSALEAIPNTVVGTSVKRSPLGDHLSIDLVPTFAVCTTLLRV